MLDLGVPIQDVFEFWGDPVETKEVKGLPDATQHTIFIGEFHEVVATEWKGVAHSFFYWSQHSYPGPDLKCVANRYSEGQEWSSWSNGYSYLRADRKLWIHCSFLPAVGVLTAEYREMTDSISDDESEEEVTEGNHDLESR